MADEKPKKPPSSPPDVGNLKGSTVLGVGPDIGGSLGPMPELPPSLQGERAADLQPAASITAGLVRGNAPQSATPASGAATPSANKDGMLTMLAQPAPDLSAGDSRLKKFGKELRHKGPIYLFIAGLFATAVCVPFALMRWFGPSRPRVYAASDASVVVLVVEPVDVPPLVLDAAADVPEEGVITIHGERLPLSDAGAPRRRVPSHGRRPVGPFGR